MMSTKMMSGWLSVIIDMASKPSEAVSTSYPAFLSSASAVRRMVLLSSMIMTFILTESTLSNAQKSLVLLAGKCTGEFVEFFMRFHA